MSYCRTCDNQSSIIDTQSTITQKIIQKQVRVHSSLYTMNFATMNNTINNDNEGKKFDSYQRYLMKKKGKVFSKQGSIVSSSPSYGNKTQSYNISAKVNTNCDALNCA